jgi:ABC-type multidrug transport system ATPase subunit
VSVASQLITSPKILFLDEPTSGLDSAASYEVMKFVRDIAKKYKVLVVASIHQPSTTTFELFDKLMLLSRGQVCYNGPVRNVKNYFAGLGYDVSISTSLPLM